MADRLREALAEGRLTPDEHAERLDAAYNARTYGELEPLLHDLPSADEARPRISLQKDAPPEAPPRRYSTSIAAVFSAAERRGRWMVEAQTSVSGVFGSVELDFRRAVLSQREVTVSVAAIFGSIEMIVPPGVRVVNETTTIFGQVENPDDDGCDLDAPTIRLTGFAFFGSVEVKRREAGATRADRRRDRKEARRAAVDAHHDSVRRHLGH
ncbi:DUF1707 and DUF2154 domain-containing protein [Actinomadura flavalba]|uniref:DUF1707 SHOCT-like domain-containing protein n=1 Tax=Actinomadura flavalba TaxID=1120938 RepID=UPI000380D768